MEAKVRLLSRRLSLSAIVLAMLLLGISCGSGGDSSTTPTVTGSVPTGGTTPDTTGATPTTPPADDGATDRGTDRGTDDDASEPDGSDGGSDGGVPEPEPPVPARSWDGFESAFALTTDPGDGTAYTIQAETSEVFRKQVDDETPLLLGTWVPGPTCTPGPVRGLAWPGGAAPLLAVVDRGPTASDELIEIDLVTLEARLIGPIGGRTEIESLAWYRSQSLLYSVDKAARELIAIDPGTGDVLRTRALDSAFSDIDGLAVDDEGRCLYGSDASRGMIVQFAPLNVMPVIPPAEPPVIPPTEPAEAFIVPEARLMGRTTDGRLQGLAFVHAGRLFFGVDPDQSKLFLSDPMGHGIHAAELHGLAVCADDGLLYASHVGNTALVGINRDSGWKHYVGVTGIPMLEGLADAEPGAPHLYGISSETQEIYRIDRESGTPEVIGPVDGLGSPWYGLKSLAFATGQLLAVDERTGDLLAIDPATGVARVLAVLEYGGIQSLAYQADAGMLHGYSDLAQVHFQMRLALPGTTVQEFAHPYPAIGGLAWAADDDRLWASDLTDDRLTVLYEVPKPASMPYEAVHAITWTHDVELLAADTVTGALFTVDSETQATAERIRLLDANIEAMAADTESDHVYLSDTNGPYLLVMRPGGAIDYVGAPGPPVVLPTDGIKAMAWDRMNQVLYGVDLNGAGGATVVTIDPATGAVTAFPQPIGFDTIEALTWDPQQLDGSLVRLLAVDRATRTLVRIDLAAGDPNAGAGYPSGIDLPEELGDVRGATAPPHDMDVIQLVDAVRRRIYTIDCLTGEILR